MLRAGDAGAGRRKFLSWALAREFLATGAHILWRASAAFTLRPVKVLADGTSAKNTVTGCCGCAAKAPRSC
jgi:hypothetical protein